MKTAFAVVAVIHGAIHLFGFAKGLGLAHIPQLQLPISKTAGWTWLGVSIALVLSVVLLYAESRYWGLLMIAGLAVSQWLILRHFRDAKFGTVANLLLVLPALTNAVDLRPSSLRSEYLAAVARITETPARPVESAAFVTEADLAALPSPVQRYLRRVGVVDKPRVHNAHVRFAIQIRKTASEPWMEGIVDQYSDFDRGYRFFFLEAKRGLLPIDVTHLYDERGASMRGRVLGILPVLDASGDELTKSETVTMLNDMSLFAPAALLLPSLVWEPIDANSAGVTLVQGHHRVSARLVFSHDGDLVNFVSRDRAQSDGETSRYYPWWTPLSDYQSFGDHRLASLGEAQWEEPSGLWTYARIRVLDVRYNVHD